MVADGHNSLLLPTNPDPGTLAHPGTPRGVPWQNRYKKLADKQWREHCKARDEIEQLKAKIEKYEQAEKRLIDEFGTKSYEYGIYSGETTTSETNETCRHSTTQEEPLEVIKLDDDVVYNLKQMDSK